MTNSNPPKPDQCTLSEPIGSGSFSNVYKGYHRVLKKTVAVKCYKMKNNVHAHFYNTGKEIALLNILKHPNIIDIIGFDIQKSYMYMMLEFCMDGNLKRYTRTVNHMFTEKNLQYVTKQIASGLIYLHSHNIFHGDIKPENIMVTSTQGPQIKIIDFGLSDVYIEEFAANYERAGSTFYMAPEQLLGFPFNYTCDLYSLGVLVYEIIYGKMPFRECAKHVFIHLYRKRTPIPFPPTTVFPVSANCLDFVKRQLSYDKQNRLQGFELQNHPFIKLEPLDCDSVDHYQLSMKRILETVELAQQEQFGNAFATCVEAVYHLKIYYTLTDSSKDLKKYLVNKSNEYLHCAFQLEALIQQRHMEGAINITKDQYEVLKSSFQSTPAIFDLIDIGFIGEMYYKEHNMQLATQFLNKCVGDLLKLLPSEPDSTRKNVLLKKLEIWLHILEYINGRVRDPPTLY